MQQKKAWFLRKTDGSEYGPVSLSDLLRWSAQCRLVAGNAVSIDREEWVPVESLPELEMNWVAHRADGKAYGPFALHAVQELFAHKILPAEAILINRQTGEQQSLAKTLNLPEEIAAPAPQPAGRKRKPNGNSAEPEAADVSGQPEAPQETTEEQEKPEAPQEPPNAPDEPVETEAAVTEVTEAATDTPTNEQPAEAADGAETPLPPAEEQRSESADSSTLEPGEKDPLSDAVDEQTRAMAATPEEEKVPNGAELFPDLPSSPPEPHPAEKELAKAKKALSDGARRQKQEVERFTRESEALHQQIETLQQQFLKTENEAAEKIQAHIAQNNHLQEALKVSQKAVLKAQASLNALEEKRTVALQETADDVADLRKQTAFMKKNIAVLHAELDSSRRQSVLRGKIVLALSTVLTLIAAMLIMRAAGGCRRSESDEAKPRQHTGDGGSAAAVTGADTTGTPPSVDGVTTDSAWPTLNVNGMNISTTTGQMVIRFDDGAFSSLATLSPQAGESLKALAEQLRSTMTRYRLTIEGHTDNIPMRPTAAFADNEALARARAEAAAAFLQREAGLPAEVSLTPGPPPYPNDTPDNRRRNRTVRLLLTPR